MLVTRDVVYTHLPKTGGRWVWSVLDSSGTPFYEVLPRHAHATEATREIFRDKKIMMTVRHPVSWWMSYWNFSLNHHWPAANDEWLPVTRDPKPASDFSVFMDFIFTECPGFYSDTVRRYARHADIVVRTENLAEELGGIFPSARIPDAPARESDESLVSPEVAVKIMESESYVAGMYYGGL